MDKDIKTGFELGLGNECSSGADTAPSPPETDNADYEVGYGRPPKDKQFKAGKSGNPKGRPKHAKTFGEGLDRVLSTIVSVPENGVQKRRTYLELIVKKYINEILSGNFKALSLFVREDARYVNIDRYVNPTVPKEAKTAEEEARDDEINAALRQLLDERHRA